MTSKFWNVSCLLAAVAMALHGTASAAGDRKQLNRENTGHPWTFLIYGAADNNADGPILHFLHELRHAWDNDPGIEMLLFLDRSDGFSEDAEALGEDFTGARLYRLRKDSAERLSGLEEFPEITLDSEFEANSADPNNLKKFIRFAKKHYPANRYGLMIYGHADGVTMCPDEESMSDMGIAELTDVLGENESVDFLGLELCNMGGIEIAYQWRLGNGGFYTEVLVAIPNAGPPLDWGRAFARIRTVKAGGSVAAGTLDPATLSAEDFACLLIEEGGQGRLEYVKQNPHDAERAKYEAVSAYDLYAVEEVKVAVDELSVALSASDAKAEFLALRGNGSSGCAMNYVRDQLLHRPYVDLYDLARRTAASDTVDASVRAAAVAVMKAVDAFVLDSFAMSGYQDFQPGKNGVFVVFPDGDAKTEARLIKGATTWRNFAWYTPLELGDRAAGYGNWAWCRDGAIPNNQRVENWYELLDSWFDGADADTNHYRW